MKHFRCPRSYLSYLSQYASRPHESESDLSVSRKAAACTLRFLARPSAQHKAAALEILEEEDVQESEAGKILEREIAKECREFAAQSLGQPLFLASGKLGLDILFSTRIAKIGAHGKKLAEEILAASESWREAYLRDRRARPLFKLWSDGRHLKLLAEILWKDRASQQFEKSRKQLPAITQSVHRPLSRVLSPLAKVLTEAGRPSILFCGKMIAETSAVDPKLLPLIAKGAGCLSTIYHHKLLRYQCRCGFEHWIEGHGESRTIRIDGGAKQLANDLGFKFKEAPSILRAILHAQAYMEFTFDDGSRGSLIALKQYPSPATKRIEGIEILLSDQLMPAYTFQTARQGKLLVPVADFPPFVSAPQFHAGQALLQMLVLEELTQRSLELAAFGSIEIPNDRWDEFFRLTLLPESVYLQTREAWLGTFLSRTNDGRYYLADACQKEKRFLEKQGEIRKERQRQGRISVRKRNASLSLQARSP